MKVLVYIITALVIFISIALIVFSVASRKQPELGLLNGQLRPCPATPNCVCSERQAEGAYVEPLGYTASSEQGWEKIKMVISETGGTVITEEADYLRVIYKTPVLRYVDDVEFRHDKNNQQIHVRSASRVGSSDWSTNRKRVEKIRKIFRK